MSLFRRTRTARMTFTPQTLTEQAAVVTPRQQRVFTMVQRKDERLAQRARAQLTEHARQPRRAIPLSQHDRVWRQMGWARSAQWLFVVVLPLLGTLALALSHAWVGLACLAMAGGGVVGVNLWRAWRIQRMELAPLEWEAMKKIALGDPVARPIFLAWKKDGLPMTQEEFQLVENWVSAQKQVTQWEEAQALANKLTPKTGRRFGRHHRR